MGKQNEHSWAIGSCRISPAGCSQRGGQYLRNIGWPSVGFRHNKEEEDDWSWCNGTIWLPLLRLCLITLCETWLDNSILDHELFIEKYSLIRRDWNSEHETDMVISPRNTLHIPGSTTKLPTSSPLPSVLPRESTSSGYPLSAIPQ